MGLCCPCYGQVCAPFLLYSKCDGGGVQSTDQTTRWSVVLIDMLEIFWIESPGCTCPDEPSSSERVGWGWGELQQELTRLFWQADIAREIEASYRFFESLALLGSL